jgi:hypothetical protein
MIHDEECRKKMENFLSICNEWSLRNAAELLDLCETLDPTEIYDCVKQNPPSAYVIAHLVVLAKDAQRSKSAQKAAIHRHEENHAMKADVFQWLDLQAKFKSNEAAAMAITKQQPIAHVTARDWYKDWKKLRSASTP